MMNYPKRALQVKRFAPLIAILGLVTLIVGGLIYVLNRTFDLPVQIILSLGVVLLAVAAILRPDAIQSAISGRRAKYGSNAVVMTLAFVGILAVLNFLGQENHKRFDLTEDKDYTLSPQTIQILENLKEPVHIIGFFVLGDSRQMDAKDLLDEYRFYTDKLTYEFVDPDVQRAFASQFENPYSGTLFFTSGDRQQRVSTIDEQALTSALLKVTQDEQKVVYFITGHGERDVQEYGDRGFSQIKRKLENDNYEVAPLILATISDTIPSDASVLVLAAPQVELPQNERDILINYLHHGGRIVALTDPGLPNPIGPGIVTWGIDLEDAFVFDIPNAFLGADPATPIIARYPRHRITEQLGSLATFYPLARPIRLLDDRSPTLNAIGFVRTSRDSWGDTGLMQFLQTRQIQFNPADNDIRGPLNIAVAVEDSVTDSRLVVFGDSDFISNQGLSMMSGQVGNADIFLNAVNWAAEEDTLISVRSTPPTNRQLFLTGPQLRLVFLITVVGLPLLVVVAGVSVWWRRR